MRIRCQVWAWSSSDLIFDSSWLHPLDLSFHPLSHPFHPQKVAHAFSQALLLSWFPLVGPWACDGRLSSCTLSLPVGLTWQCFCWYKNFKTLVAILCISWGITLLDKRLLQKQFLENSVSAFGFCCDGWRTLFCSVEIWESHPSSLKKVFWVSQHWPLNCPEMVVECTATPEVILWSITFLK